MKHIAKPYSKLLISILWIGISAASFGYLLKAMFFSSPSEFVDWVTPTLGPKTIFIAIILLIMMCLNWSIEALKWKLSISDFEAQNFTHALKATLAGIAISSWMPNRMGEYVGKVFFVKPENRTKGAISALYVSYTQIVATLFFGLIGLVYFLTNFSSDAFNSGVIAVFILAIALMITGYFWIRRIKNYRSGNHLFRSLKYFLITFTRYGKGMLAKMLALSALRFVVFTVQYILFFYLIGVEMPFLEGFLLLSVVYGLQTIIPASAIVSFGIRGSLALYFLGYVSGNTAGILTASYGLWALNLLIPSVPGFVCLLTAPIGNEVKLKFKNRFPLKVLYK